MARPIKPTVYRDPMELSQVALLGSQIDMEKFNLILHHAVGIELGNAITDARVSRTIAGSSILTVTVNDPDRNLLQSGNFNNKMDVQVDGLWWRFKSLNKQQDSLELVFEEREVALLRLYTHPTPMVDRTKITRAGFILRLIKEVKEIDIPYWIPDLIDLQPIFNKNDIAVSPAVRARGINWGEKLHVKHGAGSLATKDQITNAGIILDTGNNVVSDVILHKRKILVCSIMTGIQENSLTNSPFKSAKESSGVFQQIRVDHWPASGDVATDARAFFKAAIHYDAIHPDVSYNDLCQGVQGSGHPNAYGQWQTQAEEWVDAWGMPKATPKQKQAYSNAVGAWSTVSAPGFHYYRGIPPSRKNARWAPESSWDCIQRLADDVQWRAFFVSGTFYYMKESELFESEPRAILAEYDDGVDYIDGDYDENKKSASVSITLRMGRYNIPPGSVVKLRDMGPFNGRWLVETVERNMYDPSGTLELKKPEPVLAEPRSDQLSAFQKTPTGGKTPLVPGTQGQIPFTMGDVIENAKKILQYAAKGRYRNAAGNTSQIKQWQDVRDGKPWTNQCIAPDPTQVVCSRELAAGLLWLLDSGWSIATSALCEDHSCRVKSGTTHPISQHSMGKAMDIHEVNYQNKGWRNIGYDTDEITRQYVMTLATVIRLNLNPMQIICEGVGGREDDEIEGYQFNDGKLGQFYDAGDHQNHVHVGW